MVDTASGGALVNKTPEAARELISNMDENSQQFGARIDGTIRRVNEELCTNKMRLRIDEKLRVGENVSAVIKRTLPEKCADPGMFTLPCVIGNKRNERVMLDLGASINVMPYSIYCALRLSPLKETQLADRSNAYPEGIVEDVLVQETFEEKYLNEDLELSAQLDMKKSSPSVL
ncbi:PREDICTED: uncharacterized protein LOC104590716 [Nelumbo nucifera]|uniref:Uncharacterized protein LOC104590716 n=1 Tax=Nelumbo nucifera TaxID=4432 RepID=A0A1U7Z5Z2_NELNU|nr:PREDICTED: uncharacterized protein LOC104590716 [Nelumbo nucifera]